MEPLESDVIDSQNIFIPSAKYASELEIIIPERLVWSRVVKLTCQIIKTTTKQTFHPVQV